MSTLTETLLCVLMTVAIFCIFYTTLFIFGIFLNIAMISYILGIIILLLFRYNMTGDDCG
jgi:hypothetical protein